MVKKTKVFNGKRYYLWDSSFTKGKLSRQASSLRGRGLKTRVVAVPNKYAPKDVSYELYVYGSIYDTVRR